MVVEPDKTTLLTIDFRLAEVEGDASLSLTLVRPDGQPVEGAQVFIDGRPFGTTGSGGTVRVEGLARGKRSIRATASGHEAVEAVLQLGSRGASESLTMPWGEGVVSIQVVQGEEPVTDAVLRLAGPRSVPPLGTDGEGEARVALSPGTWTLLVSSVVAGLHQQEIEVPPGRELTSFTISLERVGSSTLLVRVRDEDGMPVAGATVELTPGPTTSTSAGGAALLSSLVPGPTVLRVDVLDRELAIDVGDGSEQLTVEALWPRSPVTVRTTDDTGQGVAADLLLQGAGLLPVEQTDRSGRAVVDLRPGAWRAWGRAGELEGSATFEVGLGEEAKVDVVLAPSEIEMNDGIFRFDEAVLFDVGSASLKPEAMPVVDALAARLKADPTIVLAEVHGHTDDTGTMSVNMRLSEARARTVLQALVERGVPSERLRARGFAMLRPVVIGTDPTARSANRRVEVVVTDRSAR
jgi:outer membrane protein OmpA-like peptidoglycan-associated protein